MISRLFKDIFISFRRTPLGSAINVLGMSSGIALFLLIMLFIRSELQVNRDNPNYKHIYRLVVAGDESGWSGTPPMLGEIIAEGLPEVVSYTRFQKLEDNNTLQIDNEVHELGSLVFCDSSFFSSFPMEFIMGSVQSCMEDPRSIILTRSTAERIFGSANPAGRQVVINDKFALTISAVIKDLGNKTHIQGNAFIPFRAMPVLYESPTLFDCFGCFNYETYLKVNSNIDIGDLETKIAGHLNTYAESFELGNLETGRYKLQSLFDVYFLQEERPAFRKGNIVEIRIFISIAILILLVAMINYVNLATAQSGARLRELAIRKAMGASRTHLMRGILLEASFMGLLSVNIGLILVELLKPLFSLFLNTSLTIGYIENPWIYFIFIIGGTAIGLIAGIYPAFYITRFDASQSLQESIQHRKKGGGVRKILTIIQLTASMVLIISTLTIALQLRFVQKSDPGFDKDILIYLPLNEQISGQKDAFRQQLTEYSGIINASFSYGSYRLAFERWGLDYNDENISLHIEAVDEHYLPTLGLELIEGRNLIGIQDSNRLLINEAAKNKYFGDNPMGLLIESMRGGTEILGVVRDYSFESFHNEIEPIAILFNPSWANYCNIRFERADISRVLDHIESVWEKFSPSHPFSYGFVDELFLSKYLKEIKMARLMGFFSVASILIAFLGIFGLITFTVGKRSQEVAIRKVNGASVSNIVRLLSTDITITVFYAALPAIILGSFLMIRWLNNFAYHISFPLWTLPFAFLMVWFISLAATNIRVVKTARMDPAKVLRNN